MSPELWLRAFGRLALHMPGLGGIDSFNALHYDEAVGLIRQVDKHLKAQADAWRK